MTFETFDPAAYGLKLQHSYQIRPAPRFVEDPMELGNVESVAVAEKVLRRFEGLVWRVSATTPNMRRAAGYALDFYRRHVGPAGRFWFELPEFVADPSAPPVVEAVSGGSLSSRTYLVSIAWLGAAGETLASELASLTIPANELIKVTLPVYPNNVSKARIYATAGASGTEVQQAELTDVREWTEPTSGLVTGTGSPASVNTATDVSLCKFEGENFQVQRGQGLFYEVSASIQEVYNVG